VLSATSLLWPASHPEAVHLQAMRTDELSGYTPYSVLPALVQQYKGKWDIAAERCVTDVHGELQKLSKEEVAAVWAVPRAEEQVR